MLTTTSPLQPPPRLPQKPPHTRPRTCVKGPQPDFKHKSAWEMLTREAEPILLSQRLQRLAEDDSLSPDKAEALRGSASVSRRQSHQSKGSTKPFWDTTIHGGPTRMQKQMESKESSAASQPQACRDGDPVSSPKSRTPRDLEDRSACVPVDCSLTQQSFSSRAEPHSLRDCLGGCVSVPLLCVCGCVSHSFFSLCLSVSVSLAFSVSLSVRPCASECWGECALCTTKRFPACLPVFSEPLSCVSGWVTWRVVSPFRSGSTLGL